VEKLTIRIGECSECGVEVCIERTVLYRSGSRFGFDASDELEAAAGGAAMVCDVAAGHAVGPGESGVGRDIFESTPQGHHGVGHDIVDRIGVDPTTNVTLDGFVDLGGEILELLPATG
jgi:hypothetical protein